IHSCSSRASSHSMIWKQRSKFVSIQLPIYLRPSGAMRPWSRKRRYTALASRLRNRSITMNCIGLFSIVHDLVRKPVPTFRDHALGIESPEHDAGVGPAEAERVRQHRVELHIVAPLAHDRNIVEGGIEVLDIGALADEAVVHHQQRIDRFLHA